MESRGRLGGDGLKSLEVEGQSGTEHAAGWMAGHGLLAEQGAGCGGDSREGLEQSRTDQKVGLEPDQEFPTLVLFSALSYPFSLLLVL